MKAILITGLIALASLAWGSEPEYVTYDNLIRQVEAGNVKSVTLDGLSSITGTMVDGSVTNDFRSYGKTGSANDPLLVRFLKENDVAVTMRDASRPSHTIPMLTGFMFLGAPILFLVLMIVIIKKLNRLLANQESNQQRN
jgi:ATP-dependent Zn protease